MDTDTLGGGDVFFYALVTGVNRSGTTPRNSELEITDENRNPSGLGFAICCRLIDEFLQTRPHSHTLVLIITTRDRRKSDDAAARLQKHLQRACHNAEKKMPGIGMLLQRRVRFQQELLDLTSILSVLRLGKKLRASTARIDALLLNAGIGGWTGIDWTTAVYTVLTDWVQATTWPVYKRSSVGWVTKPQLPSVQTEGRIFDGEASPGISEPPLGEVFCANVFGHYLLAHDLVPLLSARSDSEGGCGRIIWLSSLDTHAGSLSLDDLQSITKAQAYESSKRVTDVLVLTSELGSTGPWVDHYLSYPATSNTNLEDARHTSSRPRIYLAHPGICATSIIPLPYILTLAMSAAFYIARFLGSMWHTCSPYTGACAPVWLALAPQTTLDALEGRDGKGKWGSATDPWGRERVARTEVEGWGWGGKVTQKTKGSKGRRRGATDLTENDKADFEELGKVCWKEMEKLRVEWEKRIGDDDA